MSPARIRLLWLLAGAATGLLLAATGLIQRDRAPGRELPDDVIARVGDHLIPRNRYLQILSDLAADKRGPLEPADREFALERLVDEELLILRGIELGLPGTAPEIRKAIAAAVISQVTAEAEASVPSEEELRDLYASDAEFFTLTERYRLHWWRIQGLDDSARRQALAAAEQLRNGAAGESVVHAEALREEPLLPDQLLPLTKLADYLGPELVKRIPGLEPGQYSEPIAANSSFNILYVAERRAGGLPAFEQIRPLVENEFLRRAGDRALRSYLAWLRQRTPVLVQPDAAQ